jgi:hypothetical protein
MAPEEFENYFPSHCSTPEDVGADVSSGKTAVASRGFHQLLVVREGEVSALSQHQADQQAHLLAAPSRDSSSSSSSGKGVQQRHPQQQNLQQQGSQHIDIPHQHAPAAADVSTTSGRLEGAKSLSAVSPTAVVVEEDGVGKATRSHATHRSIFGLPTIPPNSSLHAAWLLLMLFVDLTYTAFVNPVLIVVGLIEPFNEVGVSVIDL